ncbi:YqiA/YcfP family alpha/beta fold hydrolase [Isoalcanivorax indicus]|uniref:YqiA/YcfP family alpha/beta fold hydrolase n=1 Tax=Isoalcanivorax indicus TaxID=2202653 RepID=UPI000DBAC225|nr:YqiA/YcfP family alpha/beta fold hydrolase [Isoalcanivorax indicus]
MATSSPSLVYIHGFNSSPASLKARLLVDWFRRHGAEDRIHVPALPPEPKRAMAVLESTLAGAGPAALVGSSLGGFYATWLAAHHDLKAVLINPAVRPWALLGDYVGDMANYHTGEPFHLEQHWVDELRAYEVPQVDDPERLLVLMQTGDDTLDWRDTWDFYEDCHLYRGLGGSHGFDDFDAFIPLVLRFCGIALNS